jgi:hypothetical protein
LEENKITNHPLTNLNKLRLPLVRHNNHVGRGLGNSGSVLHGIRDITAPEFPASSKGCWRVGGWELVTGISLGMIGPLFPVGHPSPRGPGLLFQLLASAGFNSHIFHKLLKVKPRTCHQQLKEVPNRSRKRARVTGPRVSIRKGPGQPSRLGTCQALLRPGRERSLLEIKE